MRKWTNVERRFLVHPYQVKPIKFKIRAIAAVVIVLGMGIQASFVGSYFYAHSKLSEIENVTTDPWTFYVLDHNAFVFVHFPSLVPNAFSLGILLELLYCPMNFAWSYMELFVMMVCIGLVARFHQINERLDGIRGRVRDFLPLL
jgi:hypothetical protein